MPTEFLSPAQMARTQALHIYETTKIVVIYEDKNIILRIF